MSKVPLTETQEADTCEIQQLRAEVDRLRAELAEARRGPQRKRLPHTRRSVTHKFSISGHEGYLIVGLFDDGQPGEVFIKMAKQGSTMSGLVDTIAILISMALQFGVPVQRIAEKFQDTRFEPSGHTRNSEIPLATSISDYIAAWLGLRFSEPFREAHAERRRAQA